MKTGGEKHNNWKYDLDWNLMTPPHGVKKRQKAKKSVKKDRIKEYKRRARRLVKQLTSIWR